MSENPHQLEYKVDYSSSPLSLFLLLIYDHSSSLVCNVPSHLLPLSSFHSQNSPISSSDPLLNDTRKQLTLGSTPQQVAIGRERREGNSLSQTPHQSGKDMCYIHLLCIIFHSRVMNTRNNSVNEYHNEGQTTRGSTDHYRTLSFPSFVSGRSTQSVLPSGIGCS